MIVKIPMQETSIDVWRQKYQLKDKDGNPVDRSIKDTFRRVAKALAEVEKPEARKYWYEQFLWAMESGAIPAGRILSNAGALEHKPATSTINCTVSGTVEDSMDSILSMVKEAGMTLKAGCGIGYEFSTLRPKGSYVKGAGASTSGPLSFMDIFDKMCFTVSSAGGRRGAQMATFDIRHPDVVDFIKAKREDGRFRQFNLSVLITDEFMEAVKNDETWEFRFNDEPYGSMPAKELFDLIMESNYNYAEPGFILIDKVNKENNLWFCEDIRATNPCGEQPLSPYGSCLLGSINLTKFVRKPFTEEAFFDFLLYEEVIRIFTRMLDNVVEINGLPLPQQREEILSKRRHGMGFLGLGSTLTMLRMKYGSEKAVNFTGEVARILAFEGWYAGASLAEEKGAAPILDPEGQEENIWSFLDSDYMRRLEEQDPGLPATIRRFGSRFTHHSSIAPTGTISLSIGNNVSNGIEPTFSHKYYRNIIKEGRKTKEQVPVYSYELLAYRALVNPNADPDSDDPENQLPDYFVTTDDVTPQQHIEIQAAAQKWIDSGISKTINVPSDISFEDFKGIYMQAYEKGLKGCTTFRFNPEAFQGVLVREDDLENTVYQFTLSDGSTVELKGNDIVEYDGEEHTAGNLYDALKEGYYGKF